MIRHAGRASLIAGLLSWAILIFVVLFGPIDPPVKAGRLFVACGWCALLAALLSVGLGVVGLLRKQRVSSGFGISLSILFLLYFTGLGFALFR